MNHALFMQVRETVQHLRNVHGCQLFAERSEPFDGVLQGTSFHIPAIGGSRWSMDPQTQQRQRCVHLLKDNVQVIISGDGIDVLHNVGMIELLQKVDLTLSSNNSPPSSIRGTMVT